MRLSLALLGLLVLAALPALPQASAHGDPATDPRLKQVLLYPTSTGALDAALPGNVSSVPAGPANVDGTSAPVVWTVAATRNSSLASAPFVALTVLAQQATVVAGGPNGSALEFALLLNGKQVPGALAYAALSSTVLQPGTKEKVGALFPAVEAKLRPGDVLGLQVRFFGLNPEQAPAVAYQVGGATNSRLVFQARLASMRDVDLPPEVGPWDVQPLDDFDFRAAARRDPAVKEFTLEAFQFGFHGAPVVVPNGSRVVLHLYVNESYSASQEGHGGHGGHGPGEAAGAWDQVQVAPLHGFNLGAYDGKLQTVLFDSLVVTLEFTADRPGNYTFLCTVFCGSGHGTMMDRLSVAGAALQEQEQAQGQPAPAAPQPAARTPAPSAPLVLAAVGGAALAARGLRGLRGPRARR